MQPVYRPEMLELADRYTERLRHQVAPRTPRSHRIRHAAGRALVRLGERLAAPAATPAPVGR